MIPWRLVDHYHWWNVSGWRMSSPALFVPICLCKLNSVHHQLTFIIAILITKNRIYEPMFISQMKIKCFERNILNARLNQRMISLDLPGGNRFFFSACHLRIWTSSSGESICRLLVTGENFIGFCHLIDNFHHRKFR